MRYPTNATLDWYTLETTATAWGTPSYTSTAVAVQAFVTQDKPWARMQKAVEDQNDRLAIIGRDYGFIKGDRFIVDSLTYECTNIDKDSDINGRIWNVELTLKELA